MQEELKSFENEAWELVNKPIDAKVVRCKQVYKKKLNVDNTVRNRARLIAKCSTQCEGIDYKENFSPVLKYSTLKLLLASGVKHETVYMQLSQILNVIWFKTKF